MTVSWFMQSDVYVHLYPVPLAASSRLQGDRKADERMTTCIVCGYKHSHPFNPSSSSAHPTTSQTYLQYP
jgi:hypothetical protein